MLETHSVQFMTILRRLIFVNGTLYTYIKAQTHQETVAWRTLTCISMQNLIRIYHVIQELFAFLLTANGRTDGRTDSKAIIVVHTNGCYSYMRSRPSKTAVKYVSGKAMLIFTTMRNLIKTYHVFHEL